jgi:predicted ribosomally synthesized peptide with SipW-like signal peptide
MKKKILIVSLVVAVLAVAVIGGTLAWFTDTEGATNTFTVGDVEIALREPAWNGIDFGTEWDDLTWDEVTNQELGVVKAHNFVPSRVIPKDPTVKVEGTNPCYIRVKVTIPDVSYDTADLAKLDSMFTTVNTSWFDTDWAQDGGNYIKYFYY